jgi:glycosyltransferase involved in cell wall biosynthesis
MVILHTETLKKWGGQQKRVLAEAAGLKRRGHKVIIACHRNSMLSQKLKENDLAVYEVNMVKQAHMATIPRLINVIRKEKVQIVSTHSSVDSWAGGIAARIAGIRLVRFRHNMYPIGGDPLTQLIYSMPDRIIAVSDSVKNVLTGRGLRGERITVINDCVDVGDFDPGVDDLREELNIPPGTIVIGNTSTFTEVKGQAFLLRAFNIICRKHPCVLLFAGRLNEPDRSLYLSNVEKGLRDNVILLGHREDIPRVLKTIDIFVHPSTLEGLGTALIEAMAMEKPVVVSDIPTFRNFIVDGVNGIFFKAGDPADLAEKTGILLKNEGFKRQLGSNARSTVKGRFSPDRMLDLTESVYEEVLYGQGKNRA